MTILSCVADLPLIDHHCHGVVRRDLDRTGAKESGLDFARIVVGEDGAFALNIVRQGISLHCD